MREYELTVLIHPDLEADLETALTKVRGIITNNGGEITSEENQGKKKLAYKIGRQDFAIYVYMELNLPADAPLKISNTFNITDEVLRYLLLTTNDKIREAREKAAAGAASRESRDSEER
jgi:small subunit ribosomal protein S6